MKTFFHPAAAVEDNPAILRLWGFLRNQAGKASAVIAPAARRILPTARKHPKIAFLGVIGVGSAMFADIGGADGMPGLAKADRKALPAPVEEAAREVFDGRFVKHGDSHYSVRVVCVPNIAAEMSKIPLLGGDGKSRTKAPMLTYMELIEIKNLRTEVRSDKLTKSDELNDVRWKGQLMVRGEVERRRQLDLSPWAERILRKETPSVPWLGTNIAFEKGSFIDKKEMDDLMNGKAKDGDFDALAMQQGLGAMMNLFTGVDFSEEAMKWLKGGNWGDWIECDKRSYQTSDIQLRGETARITTLESPELAFDGKPEVTLFALHAGNFFQVMSLEDTQEISFLVKPDIKALRKAGLLK